MSHIPHSAMKHAAPAHHNDTAPPILEALSKPVSSGFGAAAWLTIGGTVLASAVAIALPLIRGEKNASSSRRGKKAKTE